MKVCVFSGSPKGKYSITLQTVLYLKEQFPDSSFEILHVGQRIKAYEKSMEEAVAAVQRADLLLFCYPVYTFLAPYQLHRFLELLKACKLDMNGKCAAQISTSKHFYDMTAQEYIKQNCLDLGLRYLHGLSADMDDLLSPTGQKQATDFFKYVLFCAQNGLGNIAQSTAPVTLAPYQSTLAPKKKREGFPTVLVTNRTAEDHNLAAMIADFQAAYPYELREINIAEYPFAGGCLGCFHCATSGKCIYKDGFDAFLRTEIQTASAIVYAFSIKEHSMGASFKRYDDRQFCNGHRTVTAGMPVGYLVYGDYENEPNLRIVLEARAQVGGNFLAGVATCASEIDQMSQQLCYALEQKPQLPANFYGVGGMKIFRDLIYLMRGLMKADHQYYKAHGVYDFPQKQRGRMLMMMLVGGMMRNPFLNRHMGNRMNEGMIAPYQKVLKQQAKRLEK
ncbi:MAG: NAD(P)H-dependent oxidoreductase [Clostridia bacterium]